MVMLLLCMLLAGQGEDMAANLEEALYREQTLGDVRAALESYNHIINHAPQDDPIRMQALYRSTLCFIRINETPAALVTLKSLRDDFPAEKRLIEKLQQQVLLNKPQFLSLGKLRIPIPNHWQIQQSSRNARLSHDTFQGTIEFQLFGQGQGQWRYTKKEIPQNISADEQHRIVFTVTGPQHLSISILCPPQEKESLVDIAQTMLSGLVYEKAQDH